jgi:hypothetical protein
MSSESEGSLSSEFDDDCLSGSDSDDDPSELSEREFDSDISSTISNEPKLKNVSDLAVTTNKKQLSVSASTKINFNTDENDIVIHAIDFLDQDRLHELVLKKCCNNYCIKKISPNNHLLNCAPSIELVTCIRRELIGNTNAEKIVLIKGVLRGSIYFYH